MSEDGIFRGKGEEKRLKMICDDDVQLMVRPSVAICEKLGLDRVGIRFQETSVVARYVWLLIGYELPPQLPDWESSVMQMHG